MAINTTKIALISNDKVGQQMAGPAIRYWQLSKAFSHHFPTVLFVPDSYDKETKDFEIRTYNSRHATSSIVNQISDCNYVISQNLRPRLIKALKRKGIRYIADLYDPLVIEILEYAKYDSPSAQKRMFSHAHSSLLLQLHSADHILCACERQKDLYTGIMSACKMITPEEYSQSPDLGNLVSLMPFGIDRQPPVSKDPHIMERKFPAIKSSDKIVYWGGGIWNWFDPLTVIKAIEKISRHRQDIKLFFLGTKHPNPKIKEMEMAQKTLDYCQDNDLLNKFVFFDFIYIFLGGIAFAGIVYHLLYSVG